MTEQVKFLKPRGITMSRSRIKKLCYVLKGGPLDGKSVYLSSPGSLPICVNGQSGYYDSWNVWVADPIT